MSQAADVLARLSRYTQLQQWPRVALLGAAAAIIAVVVAVAMWAQAPAYRVLYNNLDDRDGSAIVNALAQMNIPYRFADQGGALMVPADRLHEARLQLAGQGLPRGGNTGFELFDQTRFGASQFAEQITYQRALEGELAASIKSLHAVQAARIHLAIPRETLFVRDRQAPTASVLLTLHPGRALSEPQVAAITWLVSASVPNLAADKVSVVDQNGRLLTTTDGAAAVGGQQRHFIDEIEQRAVQRIMTVLTPLLGSGNVRAQVSADIDFSLREQTSEVYRPNQRHGEAAVRSEQTSYASQASAAPAQGIPGALTNQPPTNPVAPIVTAPAAPAAPGGAPEAGAAPAQAPAQAQAPAPAPGQAPAGQPPVAPNVSAAALATTTPLPQSAQAAAPARRDATINYEVDRTISHVKQPLGTIRRLSAAVVVNYRLVDGTPTALAESELAQINGLVQQAMGYSEARGDSLNVINSPFADEGPASPPVWQDPVYLDYAAQLGRYLLIALALLLIWRKMLRPILNNLSAAQAAASARAEIDAQSAVHAAAAEKQAAEINRYEDNLNTARNMAAKDPRAVAMVLRSWMDKKDAKS